MGAEPGEHRDGNFGYRKIRKKVLARRVVSFYLNQELSLEEFLEKYNGALAKRTKNPHSFWRMTLEELKVELKEYTSYLATKK